MLLILDWTIWLITLYIASFVIWRRIRAEYSESETIGLIIWMIVGGVLMGKLMGIIWLTLQGDISTTSLWNAEFDVVGIAIGGYLVGYWQHTTRSMWWGDLQDGWIEGVYWGSGIIITLTGLTHGMWNVVPWWTQIFLIWTGLLLLYFLRYSYRSFRWYHSGRVGLIFRLGMIMLSFANLIFCIISVRGYVLSLQIVWNMSVIFWATWETYRLSGRSWKQDRKQIIH